MLFFSHSKIHLRLKQNSKDVSFLFLNLFLFTLICFWLQDIVYLVMLSFLLGWLCTLIGLPSMFGYILAGVVLGPSGGNVLKVGKAYQSCWTIFCVASRRDCLLNDKRVLECGRRQRN